MPRTKEEFDKWFKESNGDPWGYFHKSVRNRFKKSINFIRRFVDDDYDGNILELGAFNGDFSILLCSAFGNAQIIINDISEVALADAKSKTQDYPNVKYYCEDILNVNNKIINKDDDTIILMLECLYYLRPEEREKALENIKKNFPESIIFISAPIKGGNYFTEKSLVNMFIKLDYELVSQEVLNMRRFGFLIKYTKNILNNSDFLRKRLANQAIFYFKPRRT